MSKHDYFGWSCCMCRCTDSCFGGVTKRDVSCILTDSQVELAEMRLTLSDTVLGYAQATDLDVVCSRLAFKLEPLRIVFQAVAVTNVAPSTCGLS